MHSPTQLLCRTAKNRTTDWIYQRSFFAEHKRISVNGSLNDSHTSRYIINGSSLIITEVKASDTGIYVCGYGSHLYHKLQLSVSGV